MNRHLKLFNSLTFVLLSCLFFGQIQADPFAWSPSTPVDNTLQAFENVTTAYDTTHKRLFAAWIDLTTDFPTYSIRLLSKLQSRASASACASARPFPINFFVEPF